ncbi:MAG: hypothetical protein GY822_27660 [Deltaproteobacteria bacterium]|nr:hypothetical protein [Deltaproteobacteria bacterium]
MSQEIESRLLDKRTQHRHVAAGRISKEALEGHISGLPDMEAESDNIAPKLYETEEDEPQTDVVSEG